MLVILTEGLTVQNEAIPQAAERSQTKTDLIIEFATLVLRIAGEMLPLFGINPPQILVVTIFSQDIDGQLLHQDLLFVRNSFIRAFIEVVLNRALIIAVSFYLQPIKLDLFSAQGYSLSHHIYPIFQGLTRVTKNEFNVDLIPMFLGVPDRFQCDRLVMRPVHYLQDALVQRLDP